MTNAYLPVRNPTDTLDISWSTWTTSSWRPTPTKNWTESSPPCSQNTKAYQYNAGTNKVGLDLPWTYSSSTAISQDGYILDILKGQESLRKQLPATTNFWTGFGANKQHSISLPVDGRNITWYQDAIRPSIRGQPTRIQISQPDQKSSLPIISTQQDITSYGFNPLTWISKLSSPMLSSPSTTERDTHCPNGHYICNQASRNYWDIIVQIVN